MSQLLRLYPWYRRCWYLDLEGRDGPQGTHRAHQVSFWSRVMASPS